ncbi:hypothetical protein PP175_18665 [Aneurinibacillus sp. Ricciae_BoGa-3]|uniref:hypothetical protein n=1 Tax=Aneurinibacillus sp. Ricciae_BoGa-3 TaxID=3022697 RepID=UPI002341012F|nr:hypothetical protein [Aneurinibacillus sp. Ricciae_BoGa-3]WCK53359.1 hypothetical protein PP175_18665 [Aneurinibacillus sp. Ricciae_BoGa-3]
MNLKDVIEQINGRIARSILDENGFLNGDTRQEEGEDKILLQYLLNEKMVAQQAKKLTDSEKIVLAFFIFGVGHDMVTYRQLEMWSRTAPYCIISGLTGLRRKGLVYTLRRLWGELAYIMPYDLQKIWRVYLLGDNHSDTSAEGLEATNPSVLLCDVLFSLLQAHRTQPVSLTKRGLPGVRLRREWCDFLTYEEEAFHMFYPAGQEDGTAIYVFFLELLKEMQLLIPGERGQEELIVNEKASAQLFVGDASTVQARLYPTVKRMIETQHPLYPIIFEWLESHLEQWVCMEAVCKQWTQRIPHVGRLLDAVDEKREAVLAAGRKFTEEVVPLLAMFGFVSLVETSRGVHMKYLQSDIPRSIPLEGEAEYTGNTGYGYVQPTFEVLLLPHAPYEVRWGTGAFSHLAERQEVWIFQLTRRSVQSFIGNHGAAVEDILLTLSGIHSGDVPENVYQQIRDWARLHQTASWEPVVWITCPNLETANQIEMDPVLSPAIRRKISGQEFLVDSAAMPLLTEAMEKWGVPLRENYSGGDQAKPVQRTPGKKEIAGTDYKVESVFPNLADALPELKSIPSIWYKNWQKYHGSTLRSLLEAAIAIAIPVSMEYAGEKLTVTVEEHTQHNGLPAIIAAHESRRITIPFADIGRIQLLLPKDLLFE